MQRYSALRATGAVALTICFFGWTAGPAPAQTFTWTGNAGNTNFLDVGNWNPSGLPGQSGTAVNTSIAMFAGAGSTVSAAQNDLPNGWSMGAIVTSGNSGGPMTVNFAGNGQLRLNGVTLTTSTGTFSNVAAAAQGGRDLIIAETNIQFAFGTSGQATTFYADAGRTLTIVAQQVSNNGGAVNKEGAGKVIVTPNLLDTTLPPLRGFGNQPLNINAGSVAAEGTLDGVSTITVANGAALQAGLSPTGSLSTNAQVTFQNGGGLEVVTNGTSVSKLFNATVSKGQTDTFRIILTGLDPQQLQDFNLTTTTLLQGNLTGSRRVCGVRVSQMVWVPSKLSRMGSSSTTGP